MVDYRGSLLTSDPLLQEGEGLRCKCPPNNDSIGIFAELMYTFVTLQLLQQT